MTSLRFAAAAVLLMLGGSAFAQKPPAMEVRSPQGPQPIKRSVYIGNIETRFATMDANHI